MKHIAHALSVVAVWAVLMGLAALPPAAAAPPSPPDTVGPANPLAYCSSTHTDEWERIARVRVASGDRSSGWSSNGYADYTATHFTTLRPGQSYLVRVTGYIPAGASYTDYVRLWVDFNHDQDFFDAGEEVDLGSANYEGYHVFTGTLSVPAGALRGATRMRVVLTDEPSEAVPCSSSPYGETEDYTVAIYDHFVYAPLALRDFDGGPSLTRLVVFEAFLDPGCGFCQTAAPIIDQQLAPEYASKPVLFLEHDVRVNSGRRQRWWDGWAIGGQVGYPYVMTDSGNQVRERLTSGTDYYTVYKTIVENALASPLGGAELHAAAVRSGDVVTFTVNVINRGSVTLGPGNSATVWALVYEQSESGPVSGGLTQRYVRAQVSQALGANLAPGSSAQYVLSVTSLAGVNWSTMHGVIILDYKPNPALRPYNTYQAVAVDIP